MTRIIPLTITQKERLKNSQCIKCGGNSLLPIRYFTTDSIDKDAYYNYCIHCGPIPKAVFPVEGNTNCEFCFECDNAKHNAQPGFGMDKTKVMSWNELVKEAKKLEKQEILKHAKGRTKFKVITLHEEGFSVKEIMQELKVSQATIYRIIHKHTYPQRKKE